MLILQDERMEMWWGEHLSSGWSEHPSIRCISRRKARTHQLWFEKGHFVCPAVCGVRNVCGPIADVRTLESLCENSRLLAKNLARVKITCGWKVCPKARISFCFVGNYARFPTATHRDGVCAIAVVNRIDCKNGSISKWKPIWQFTLGRCWRQCFLCRLFRDWLRGIIWSILPARARCTKHPSRVSAELFL